MTAKEALREYVESLSEDHASMVLDRLMWDAAEDSKPLTPDEIALVEQALAQSDSNDVIDHEEVEREFGLSE